MIQSKKGLLIISLVLLTLISITITLDTSGAVMIRGEIEEGDWFTWDVEITNDYDDSKNFKGRIEIELDWFSGDTFVSINMINHVTTHKSSEFINMNNTVYNLPLGTTLPQTSIPEIEDVLARLCLISTNWTENSKLFGDETYTDYAALNIENPGDSKFISSNLYWHKGAFREAFVLKHYYTGEGLDNYRFMTEMVTGESQAVYTKESGFLVDLSIDIVGKSTGHRYALDCKLRDSNLNVSWSYWEILIVILAIIIGPFALSGVIGVVVFYRGKTPIIVKEETPKAEPKEKNERKEKKKKEKEALEEQLKLAERKEELDKEIQKLKKDLPDEYIFIEQCPFCLEDVKSNQKRCPNCKGKR